MNQSNNKTPAFQSRDNPSIGEMIKAELVIASVERNRWFGISIALTFVCSLLVGFSLYAFSEAQTNTQVMFIKMNRDGSWQNVSYNAADPQLFFKTTVDHLLANYVRKRFSITPETINADYGEVQVFLGEGLLTQFLSAEAFNAPLRAQTARANLNTRTTIKWTYNDHYDEITDDNDEASIVRTNIYFTRTRTVKGSLQAPENLMLSIQWQLLPKEKLAHLDSDFLRYNPIGLSIISQRLTREPQN